MRHRVRFFASRELFGGINLHAKSDANGGSMAKTVVFESHEPGAFAEPFLRIADDEAQNLMDELWNCGLRPSEGTGSAGALAATERHLQDMRKLVLKDKA